jgi:hypothetical protein
MLPLQALLKIELQWKETSIGGVSGETLFLPFATTTPDKTVGITSDGRWAIARPVDDPERPGLLFDPTSSKGLIFLCPMLDWTPRHVMGQVNVVASSAEVSFSALWNEFPWRYAIRSGLEVSRRRYHVDAALDWVAYLGVAEEFEQELRLLGLDYRELLLPRPTVQEFET